MMLTVHLYGWLGVRFGREWRLCANSVREAMRLIECQTPGFGAAVMAHAPGFKAVIGKKVVREEGALENLPLADIVKIVPLIAGAAKGGGKGGLGLIILGAALFFAAPYLGPALGGLGLSVGTFTNMAFGLILNGVMSLISQPDAPNKPAAREEADRKPSYVFDGAVNTVEAGHCVPVLYGGPLRIGSQLISVGVSVEQVQIAVPSPAIPDAPPPAPDPQEQAPIYYESTGI
jgi:predicted phage tail protein